MEDVESLPEFIDNYHERKKSGLRDLEDEFKFTIKYKKALDDFITNFFKTRSFQMPDGNGNVTDFIVNGEYYGLGLLDEKASKEDTLEGKVEAIAAFIHDDIRRRKGYRAIIKDSQIKRLVKQRLLKGKPNTFKLYNEFLSSPEFIEAFGRAGTPINKKMLRYPDFIGFLYLNFEIGGYDEMDSRIGHIVIDECQDYSPLQMTILKKQFCNARINAFGDRMQNINPSFEYRTLEEIAKHMKDKFDYYELLNAYRSSPEIMNYIKEFFNLTELNPVREPTGNEVEKREGTYEEFLQALPNDIEKLKEKGAKRICIITRTASEAKKIYDDLSDSMIDLRYLGKTSKASLDSAVFVADVCDTKGLEFDAVISYATPQNNYSKKDILLYYIACTRALHNLIIYNEPPNKKYTDAQEIPQSQELSLRCLDAYISYSDSPYIQDFLNYINDQHLEETITPANLSFSFLKGAKNIFTYLSSTCTISFVEVQASKYIIFSIFIFNLNGANTFSNVFISGAKFNNFLAAGFINIISPEMSKAITPSVICKNILLFISKSLSLLLLLLSINLSIG